MTNQGKIGRLPQAIQEQVNRRMENGKKVRTLVVWLMADKRQETTGEL